MFLEAKTLKPLLCKDLSVFKLVRCLYGLILSLDRDTKSQISIQYLGIRYRRKKKNKNIDNLFSQSSLDRQ